MNFDITILGCGSALPVVHRNPSAQIISVSNNNYLIDCGEGTQLAMRTNHIKMQKLSVVLISHMHGDHYLGLMGLISSLSLLGRTKDLTIIGPPELKQIITLQLQASHSYLLFNLKFQSTSTDGLQLVHQDKKVSVFSFPLKHRIACTGFKIVEKEKPANIIKSKIQFYNIPFTQINNIKAGADYIDNEGKLIPNKHLVTPPPVPRSYAYCSDTIYQEETIQYVQGVDLLYHEATFLEELKHRAEKTFHSTAKDAATIARKAQVKKLILGHYSARYIELDTFIEQAQPIFENVALAIDNKIFHIPVKENEDTKA